METGLRERSCIFMQFFQKKFLKKKEEKQAINGQFKENIEIEYENKRKIQT